MKKVQSTCNYCALDCNLDFYVEDEKLVADALGSIQNFIISTKNDWESVAWKV